MGKNMVLAHCTLPFDMVKEYSLDTHFESGIGVAVKGILSEEKITIFKLSKNLKDYFVTTGRIVRNLYEDNLCRTQIYIDVDDNIEYFLNRPYGNHHVVVYGDYKEHFLKIRTSCVLRPRLSSEKYEQTIDEMTTIFAESIVDSLDRCIQ